MPAGVGAGGWSRRGHGGAFPGAPRSEGQSGRGSGESTAGGLSPHGSRSFGAPLVRLAEAGAGAPRSGGQSAG